MDTIITRDLFFYNKQAVFKIIHKYLSFYKTIDQFIVLFYILFIGYYEIIFIVNILHQQNAFDASQNFNDKNTIN